MFQNKIMHKEKFWSNLADSLKLVQHSWEIVGNQYTDLPSSLLELPIVQPTWYIEEVLLHVLLNTTSSGAGLVSALPVMPPDNPMWKLTQVITHRDTPTHWLKAIWG